MVFFRISEVGVKIFLMNESYDVRNCAHKNFKKKITSKSAHKMIDNNKRELGYSGIYSYFYVLHITFPFMGNIDHIYNLHKIWDCLLNKI